MANELLVEENKPDEFSKVCSFCKNLQLDEDRKCKAYPKKENIPMEIWDGRNSHIEKFKGDHGIQFEDIREDV